MVELDDTDNLPKKNSAIELIDYWKKGQKQLDKFWEAWRNLLSLCETLHTSVSQGISITVL